jgi:ABC-2 type transport system permease protein
MKAFLAFAYKEFTEALRTRKILVLLAVYLLLGIMNPLTAKLVPTLLKEFMPAGMVITLSEPAAMDSWAQFFKNVPQIGLIVLVILFSGIMAGELSRGTLINLLTKGLPRRTVILSKAAMACCLFTVCYALCVGVSYGYTVYYWPGQSVPHLFTAIACLWLYSVMLLAALMLGGVLFKNGYGNLLFAGGLVVLMMAASIFPALRPWLPLRLANDNMGLLAGAFRPGDFIASVAVTIALTAGFLWAAVRVFDKKQL